MLTSDAIEVIDATSDSAAGEPSAVVWRMLSVLESVDEQWKSKRVVEATSVGMSVTEPTQDTDISSLIVWPTEQYLAWQDAWFQLFPDKDFPLVGHTIDEARAIVEETMYAMVIPEGSSTEPFPTPETTAAVLFPPSETATAPWTEPSTNTPAPMPAGRRRMLLGGIGITVGLGLLVAIVVLARRS